MADGSALLEMRSRKKPPSQSIHTRTDRSSDRIRKCTDMCACAFGRAFEWNYDVHFILPNEKFGHGSEQFWQVREI